MKKRMNILMVAALCCLSLAPVTGVAQTVENDVYTIKFGRTLNTNRVFDDKFTAIDYMGEELRAGILKFGTAITGKKKENGTIEVPENASIEMKLTDAYGREVVQDVNSEALPTLLKTLKFMRNGGTSADYYTFSEIVARGGEYNLHWDYPCFDIHGDSALVIKDDPCVRIKLGEMMTVIGHDIDLTAVYNTGYPFDINSLTGDEYADVMVYKMVTDTTGIEMLKQRVPLHLKDEAHPLLAGIDSITIHLEKPEIGPYRLRFETNWEALASRDIPLSVEDTLRATVTLDKQAYDLASDSHARMTLTMDYGYPHIGAVQPDTVPTIRVAASIYKDTKESILLLTDTLVLVSDTLAQKDLHYAGEWDIDWSKIDKTMLTAADSTYRMKVTVTFNGQQQYENFIPVDIKCMSTAIRQTAALRTDDETVYTLNGIRVNPRKPLTPGVYVRKGKKIVIK